VGKTAAEELLRNMEHGGCVDEYLQDQVWVHIYFILSYNNNNIIIIIIITIR